MDPLTIAALIESGVKIVSDAYALYESGKSTMSATDQATVHTALLKAIDDTNALRAKVDAALDAASKQA